VLGAEDHTAADPLTAVNSTLKVGVYDVLNCIRICPGEQRVLRDAGAVDEDIGVTLQMEELEESDPDMR
jgi:hypothetical protein